MLLYELAWFKQSLAFPDKSRKPAFLFVPNCPSFLQMKGLLQVKGRRFLCPFYAPSKGVSSEERRHDHQDSRPRELDFLWEPAVPPRAPSPGGSSCSHF